MIKLLVKKLRRILFIRRMRALAIRIRNSKKYILWRARVLARDGHQCVECRNYFDLEVHHIRSFASIMRKHKVINMKNALNCKPLWDLKNGMTLCKACHKKTDSYMKRLK